MLEYFSKLDHLLQCSIWLSKAAKTFSINFDNFDIKLSRPNTNTNLLLTKMTFARKKKKKKNNGIHNFGNFKFGFEFRILMWGSNHLIFCFDDDKSKQVLNIVTILYVFPF